MGLPGFKPDWLYGYYSVCEGLNAMLREQLGSSRTPPLCTTTKDKLFIGVAAAVVAAAFAAGPVAELAIVGEGTLAATGGWGTFTEIVGPIITRSHNLAKLALAFVASAAGGLCASR